jgi:hypothetical protein
MSHEEYLTMAYGPESGEFGYMFKKTVQTRNIPTSSHKNFQINH